MPQSDAQRRAKAKYQKEKVRQVVVRFYPSDQEILDYLEQHENMGGYIKELIKRDMEAH